MVFAQLECSLAVLNGHNQAQNEIVTKAYATRIASTLMDTAAQAAAARAQAAVGKPTNSTPLQNGSLRQNMDLKQQFVKNIGSASASVGAAAAPAGTSNAPAGIKPIVNDSRDAMEQKKDEAWDKIESTYHPRDAMDRKKDEMWGASEWQPIGLSCQSERYAFATAGGYTFSNTESIPRR